MKTTTHIQKLLPYLRQVPNYEHPTLQGLVGWWLFNEQGGNILTDYSSYKANGDITKTNPFWLKGHGGYYGNFNENEYIRVPYNINHQFNTHGFTATAWIYFQGSGNTGGVRIINTRGTGSGGSFKGWQFKIRQQSGLWRIYDCSLDDATGTYQRYDGPTIYNLNQWYFVVMKYIVGIGMYFYVSNLDDLGFNQDGYLTFSSFGSISNNLPVAIGAAIANNGNEGTYNQYFNGFIADVRLYNVALRDQELVDIFASPWEPFQKSTTRYFFLSSPSPTINPFSKIITSSTILNTSGKTVIRRGV